MTIATLENLSPATRRKIEKLLKIDPKLIRAELARRNLINFIEYTYPAYVTEPFHRLVASKLDEVVSGETKRLMLFAPPQSGKSQAVSVHFPAYWLGKYPDQPVILCSYAAHLAHSKSWQARQVVESEDYKDVFKTTTDPEARARDNWRIANHRGELLATGVGGPITGHGAQCFPAGTMIATEDGWMDIECLVGLANKPKAWGFDHESETPQLCRILAVNDSVRRDIIRISTLNNRSLTVTSDHHIYTKDRGYRPAATLRQGKRLKVFSDEPDEITSVEVVPNDGIRVYNIQVERCHNFFANDILVHNCGIIDDPIENWEQARSEAARDRNWEWYRTTFRTRIWKEGRIVIILTRWHEDDLAGRLLSADPGQWKVLRLPAIAETQEERDDNDRRIGQLQGQPDPLGREPGEALCPNRYPIEVLEQIKKDVGERTFSAQYQGTPKAGEGSWFKKSFLPLVDEPPKKFSSLVRYWDKAASTTKKSPYSVGVLMGKWQENFWVLDVVRGRWTPGQREAVLKRVANQDRARWGLVVTWVEQEPGSGGKESAQATVGSLAEFAVRTDRPTGKKEVRAAPFQTQAEEGNVCLIRAPWNTEYTDELTFYPNSRYKDQVDASSGAYNKLAAGGTFIA